VGNIAIVEFINNKNQCRAGLASIISYCKRDTKTVQDDVKFVTGINCVANSAYNEMMNTKMQYDKTDGRMFYHLVQSFSPNEKITPQLAHQIAIELANYFKGYEVLVATHIDKEHIHSHFVINSVNADTGKKYHPDNNEIQRIRDVSDEICLKYGLSVCKPKEYNKQIKGLTSKEYRVAVKGES
jgi:hypothetical protein